MRRLALRLTTSFTLLCVVALLCVGMLTGYLYDRTIETDKVRQFEQLVIESRREYSRYKSDNRNLQELESTLGGMAGLAGCRIFLVQIRPALLEAVYDESMQMLETGYLAEDLRSICQGKTIYRPKVFWNSYNRTITFYGTSLYKEDYGYSAVLIYAPPDSMQLVSNQYWQSIWILIGIVTVGAAIMVYGMSVRISRPLHNMSHAALALAEGEEVPDIEVHTRDEVELLATAFNRMKRTLAKTERMRQSFLANVSHDMRTPLTSMIGLIEGLRDGWVPAESRTQVLDSLKSETERLVRLTGDILALARIQGGALRLNTSTFLIADLLTDIQQALDPENHRIVVHTAEIAVKADRAQLQRAVYNIVQNAVKYSIDSVEIFCVESDDKLYIHVQNHGDVIPPEQLEQLFERFYRGDSARSAGGSGLGLNIAREIARVHGGDVVAESGDEGTTFTLWLPTGHKGGPL